MLAWHMVATTLKSKGLIMAGLFDFQDPQQIRNDYMRSQMVSPAQMSQQSLLQQLTSQMSNAGTVIGNAGAGMMGLQLPEEQRQQKVQGIMQGVDLGNPQALMEASKKLSASSMHKEAQIAADRANTLNQQTLDNRLKRAEAELAEGTLESNVANAAAVAEQAVADAQVATGTVASNIRLKAAEVNYKTASIADLNSSTAQRVFNTSKSKLMLPFEIKQMQVQLSLDKQALSERQDLAPLKAQELKGRIATAQSNLNEQQARAPAALKLLQSQVDTVVKDANFRDELSKLKNPTDADITKVVNKYGSSKVIMENLNRLDAQEAQAAAVAQKREAVQQQINQKINVATAEYHGNISMIDSSDVTLKEYIKDVEDNKVDFTRTGRFSSFIKGQVGKSDEKTLKAAKIQREFVKQANLILQAASGVQTDGDAQRAFDSIITSLEKYSNSGVKQALTEIQAWQQVIKTKNIEMIRKSGGSYTDTTVDLTQFDN